MASTQCRAKNPGSCRYHGSSNRLEALIDDRQAKANLNESRKAVEESADLDQLFEAKQNLFRDQTAYDATIAGEKALERQLSYTNRQSLSAEEESEAEYRLIKAKAYRTEVLSNDSAYQEAQQKYTAFVKKNAEQVFDMHESFTEEKRNYLAGVPYGTPIALQTAYGQFYGYAGDHWLKRPSKNKASRLWERGFGKRSFVSFDDGNSKSNVVDGTLSISSSQMAVSLSDVEKIVVLKKDAYSNGFQELKNSHAVSETEDTFVKGNDRYALEGEDYYYEFEGYNGTNITNFSDEQRKQVWSSKDFSFEPEEKPAVSVIRS